MVNRNKQMKYELNDYLPDEIKNIQQKIDDNLKKKYNIKQAGKIICIFFSFDVVNSTAYKYMTVYWPTIMNELFNRLRSMVGKELETSRLWRIIGDELIFVAEVYSLDDVYKITDSIFKITQSINIMLKDGYFFENIQDQCMKMSDIMTLKQQEILSIKAAAWLAIVTDKECSSNECVHTIYETGGQRLSIEEFQGQDIDAGFRVKEYTQSRRLIVSFELAYLLSKRAPSSLHIMDYANLKGVWNGALYPLIWYYNQTIVREYLKKDIDFESSFYYDEANNDRVTRAYWVRKNSNTNNDILVDNEMYDNPETTLEKICFDRNLHGKMDYIKSILTNKVGEMHIVEKGNYPLEVHCAVVCCNVKDRTVMITRRGKGKNNYTNKWEFGCAKLNSYEGLEDTIVNHYRKMFGVDICLVKDETRKEQKMPLPIAVYEIDALNNNKKGIIFVAKIINEASEEFRKNDMHDTVKYIKKEDVDKYSSCAVPDFSSTLEMVFSGFDDYFLKKES